MLDCISEEGFWGQGDEYDHQGFGGQGYFEYIRPQFPPRVQSPVDHDYYHNWELLSNVREYPENYSAIFIHQGESLLLSIPKKIVRGQQNSGLFVHTKIFYAIVHKKYDSIADVCNKNS